MSKQNNAAPGYRGRVPIEQLVELRKQGLTYSEISARLGIPTGTVSHQLSALGLTRPRLSLETIDEMHRLHLGGYTQQQIADRFGISQSAVTRCLHRRDSHKTDHAVTHNLGPDQVAAVLAASRKHRKLVHIAREADVPVDEARRVLQRRGSGWRQGMTGTVLDNLAGTAAKQVANLPEFGLRGRSDYDALVADHGVEAVEEWIEKLKRDSRALAKLREYLRDAVKRSGGV